MGLGLEHLQSYPELLIPQALRQALPGAQIEAAPLQVWYGRLDDFYAPTLSAVILQRKGLPIPLEVQEEQLEHWDEPLNGRRTHAIRQQQMSEIDKLLLTISADDSLDPNRGVEIKDYAQIRELRRSPFKIGSSFFSNLESLLARLGYDYVWGQNSNTHSRQVPGGNVGFYIKQGWIPLKKLGTVPEGIPSSARREDPFQITTIKFLSETAQRRYLGERSLKLATAQGV